MKKKKVSRQYEWQQEHKKAGNCIQCGKKRNKSKEYCDKHLKEKSAKKLIKYYKLKKLALDKKKTFVS